MKLRRLNKNKCSQAKIQEMIFMLLGVALFFIIVFLFFVTFSLNNVKTSAIEKSKDDAILLASKLAGSPEFACPSISSEGSDSICVDSDKILALSMDKDYLKYWDVNSIRVDKIYPASDKKTICNMGNYPNCNSFVIISNRTPNVEEYSSFVSICRTENKDNNFYNLCELGKIVISPKIIRGAE